MLLVVSCGNESPDDPGTACCSSSFSPIFVESKLDDDDGDGNPADENFPAINDEDDDIADHAWIQDRFGIYHLFFQNEGHAGGNEIEHYTSTDLRSFEYVGLALARNPGAWDADALWSPHVVQKGTTYFMFYTGTAGRGATAKQRLGLATSEDLVTWTRHPVNHCPGTAGDGCIYECDESWTTWGGEPGSYNQQCRDPFVIWDAAQQRWVLFATTKSPSGSGVVTVAYSGDLVRWSGAGYVDATRRLPGGVGGQPTGGQAENPSVASHAGNHYLLFTDWLDPEDPETTPNPRTIVQYATSASLTADSSGSSQWSYNGYIPDPGVNAIELQMIVGSTWVMSQSISNENTADHDLHRRDLRLKCIVWGDGLDFETANFNEIRTTGPGCASSLFAPDPHGVLR